MKALNLVPLFSLVISSGLLGGCSPASEYRANSSSNTEHPANSSSESEHPANSSSESEHPANSSSKSEHHANSSSESEHHTNSSSESEYPDLVGTWEAFGGKAMIGTAVIDQQQGRSFNVSITGTTFKGNFLDKDKLNVDFYNNPGCCSGELIGKNKIKWDNNTEWRRL